MRRALSTRKKEATINPRHYLPLAALLVALLIPGSAQAKTCVSTHSAELQVHHVGCGTAVSVISKGKAHLLRGQHHFAVHAGWRRWGCDVANIAGYATLTCERGYGTPRRQYIIFVSG